MYLMENWTLIPLGFYSQSSSYFIKRDKTPAVVSEMMGECQRLLCFRPQVMLTGRDFISRLTHELTVNFLIVICCNSSQSKAVLS